MSGHDLTNVSKNIKILDMIYQSLPPNFDFLQIEILEKTLSANIALAELNGLILSIPNAGVLTQPLVIREAVASSEIENIFTSTIETLEAELIPDEQRNQAQKETLNYKKALMHGFELVKLKQFLATNQVVEIQSKLEPNKSGIRKIPGTVIMNGVGNIVHTPPQSETEIRELMQNWENYAHNHNRLDPLIKMAILHYQFETIHPFYDGNGRTGRILMVLHLILWNRLRFPVLFLSGFILKNKQRYYELLQSVRTDETWAEWVIFILEAVEIQSKETAEKVVKIKNLFESIKQELNLNSFNTYNSNIIDYIFSKAFYTQKDMASKFGVNRKTSAKYLNEMVENGILKVKKSGKENLYFCPNFIELLS